MGWSLSSLTASIRENIDPFLSYIKRQNNPKYGSLFSSRHQDEDIPFPEVDGVEYKWNLKFLDIHLYPIAL